MFIAERGQAFREDENVVSSRKFFPIFIEAKFQKNTLRCFW